MRRILLALAMLFFFTANQAAMAFEQCEDPFCASGMMDSQKQSDHQKKDPACAAHCAINSHHIAAMPEDMAGNSAATKPMAPFWATSPVLESAFLEGLIEPPSLA